MNTDTIQDFTVTSTEHDTLNLYQALNAGKTVVLDFFFTTCHYCQLYAPIIEQSYLNHGAGSGNILYWGIDYNDTDPEVAAYKSTYGVTNPCISGKDGNGNSVISYFSQYFNLAGYPVYAVICPNKKVFWDVNYPPVDTGFNVYLDSCQVFGVIENVMKNPVTVYPNPSGGKFIIEINNNPLRIDDYIEIYNMTGKKILETTITNRNAEIDLSDSPKGIYFLKINHKEKNYSIKLVMP